MDEETQKDDGAKIVDNSANVIPISPYSNLQREIGEEDLNTPAVQRILLSEVDKLGMKIVEVEDLLHKNQIKYLDLKERYHQKDKEKAILDEKFKTSTSQEVLYSFCLASGSAILGFAKIVWETGYGIPFIMIGIFLIIGGLISKAIKWK